MPGTQQTQGNNGPIPAAWNAIAQSLQRQGALGDSNAVQTSSLLLDHNQNGIALIGSSLNQVVTVGAGFLYPTGTVTNMSPTITSLSNPAGIMPGMVISGPYIAGTTVTAVTSTTLTMSQAAYGDAAGETLTIVGNGGVEVSTGLSGAYGIAYLSAFAFTYGEIVGSSPTIVVPASTSGFSEGMSIGANWYDPSTGQSTGVIAPGTTISLIAGGDIQLSVDSLVPAADTYSMLYIVGATYTSLAAAAVPYS